MLWMFHMNFSHKPRLAHLDGRFKPAATAQVGRG